MSIESTQTVRLSLNGCRNLSDHSIPLVLKFTPKLQVLELRGCTEITNMAPIVNFKEERGALVEGCDIFEERMRRASKSFVDRRRTIT